MITYYCKFCGLRTRNDIKLLDNDEEVFLYCKECKNEVSIEPDILDNKEKVIELEQDIHELAIEFHKEEITIALQHLVADGIVTIAGIDCNGNEYYEIKDHETAAKLLNRNK